MYIDSTGEGYAGDNPVAKELRNSLEHLLKVKFSNISIIRTVIFRILGMGRMANIQNIYGYKCQQKVLVPS